MQFQNPDNPDTRTRKSLPDPITRPSQNPGNWQPYKVLDLKQEAAILKAAPLLMTEVHIPYLEEMKVKSEIKDEPRSSTSSDSEVERKGDHVVKTCTQGIQCNLAVPVSHTNFKHSFSYIAVLRAGRFRLLELSDARILGVGQDLDLDGSRSPDLSFMIQHLAKSLLRQASLAPGCHGNHFEDQSRVVVEQDREATFKYPSKPEAAALVPLSRSKPESKVEVRPK